MLHETHQKQIRDKKMKVQGYKVVPFQELESLISPSQNQSQK
jgi:hypothetical protein